MAGLSSKRDVVDYFLKKDILLNSSVLDYIDSHNKDEVYELIKLKTDNNFLVLNKDIHSLLKKTEKLNVDWFQLDSSFAVVEKEGDSSLYTKLLPKESAAKTQKKKQVNSSVIVKFNYKENIKKREVQDFVSLFNSRYNQLASILRQRPELSNLNTITRVLSKKDKENVSVIGMISAKSTTKNGNYMLTIEDPTDEIKVLVNKNKPELIKLASSLVHDEVIGVVGVNSDKIIFANNIIQPDIPLTKELKKSPDEAYAVFLSDIHVGSNNFLEDKFRKFLKWINGELGNTEQRKIVEKVKYIFIAGDLVDGVGIYPGQDEELIIKDIYEQYKYCAELLKQIPSHIQLIIGPGNHDAMRIAEPQPKIYKDYAPDLYEMPNVTLVTNPSYINIHASKDFSGFDVLMYHGYSFDYYINNVDELRMNGGYDRADLMMKFLLQRRHLAPTHASTQYVPDADKDHLVMEIVPDFFVTGHVHKCSVADYKNVTMICGSCWQSITSFQEKVGHKPEPARVPIINLQTREKKILKF